jgi:hypothetical protein
LKKSKPTLFKRLVIQQRNPGFKKRELGRVSFFSFFFLGGKGSIERKTKHQWPLPTKNPAIVNINLFFRNIVASVFFSVFFFLLCPVLQVVYYDFAKEKRFSFSHSILTAEAVLAPEKS